MNKRLIAVVAMAGIFMPAFARGDEVPDLKLKIVDARSTTKEIVNGGRHLQVVEATVENQTGAWIRPSHPATVRVDVTGAHTVTPATIEWLAPDERAFTRIFITNDAGTAAGTAANGKVVAAMDGAKPASFATPLTLGVPAYTADPATLSKHETPLWFDDAKFGIFIHWGVYSVPAFGKVGDYAEWYWKDLKRDPNDETDPATRKLVEELRSINRRHQLALYGKDSTYDDFIPKFTADHWNPKAWVDLFHNAGAKYFVLTSKHHEGFALFKTQTTHRNAVDMGPHRDLVGDLFAASRTYYPNDLHPGLYYSLYEWFNPAYTGHPVTQWYSGKPIPYAGMKPITSYVDDSMLPQMNEIVDQYHPSIIWCDGEWEKPSEYWHDAGVIAHYYNQALQSGQGVAIDDRCRVSGGNDENKNTVWDFSTPEYRTNDQIVAKKWEASRGMGWSYGYNSAEQPKDYKTSAELIHFLVDMVSKNGNLLLDIGPKADGTIPSIMEQRLRDMGSWLRVNGEAIYGSHYWWHTSEDGNVRFTVQQNKAFYMISLMPLQSTLEIHQPIPIADGDTITLLGYNGPPLKWRRYGQNVTINIPAAARATGKYAWTLKVNWK